MGCTAFWDPRYWPGRQDLRAVEVGWTWLAASAQGTTINAEAKLLLFTHAFEVLGVTRVDLKADARNQRSAGRWSASGRHSRGCCAGGRLPRHRARKACCGTRPCSR
ncbi:GNAT family N-acetyltransferase [Nonomuraea roseola]|uniref:GNAT family N-acetyltransferase n=1 Tax=Nonomuraea roseola TaxID=46179 RepID=A0ABV5QAA0_9ACTN